MERIWSKIPGVDLKILDNLSDEDLLRTCRINKYTANLCNNENFWINRLKRNFPFLEPYKSDGRTWKNLYISYVYYYNLVKENYTRYSFGKLESKDANIKIGIAEKAAENGDLDIMRYFMDGRYINREFLLRAAAKGGHKNIIDFLIAKGAKLWDFGLYGAAEGGHLELVKFFADLKGRAISWNEVLEYAARGGHKDVIKYAYDNGARVERKVLNEAKDEETKEYLRSLIRK